MCVREVLGKKRKKRFPAEIQKKIQTTEAKRIL